MREVDQSPSGPPYPKTTESHMSYDMNSPGSDQVQGQFPRYCINPGGELPREEIQSQGGPAPRLTCPTSSGRGQIQGGGGGGEMKLMSIQGTRDGLGHLIQIINSCAMSSIFSGSRCSFKLSKVNRKSPGVTSIKKKKKTSFERINL